MKYFKRIPNSASKRGITTLCHELNEVGSVLPKCFILNSTLIYISKDSPLKTKKTPQTKIQQTIFVSQLMINDYMPLSVEPESKIYNVHLHKKQPKENSIGIAVKQTVTSLSDI